MQDPRLKKEHKDQSKDEFYFVLCCLIGLLLLLLSPILCRSQNDWRDYFIENEFAAALKINPHIKIDTIICNGSKWIVKYKFNYITNIGKTVYDSTLPVKKNIKIKGLAVQKYETVDSLFCSLYRLQEGDTAKYDETAKIWWYTKNKIDWFPAVPTHKLDKSFQHYYFKVFLAEGYINKGLPMRSNEDDKIYYIHLPNFLKNNGTFQ